MLKSLNLLAFSLLTALISGFSHAQCSVPCTMLWSDEFSGSELDLSKWQYQYGDGTGYGIPGWGNNELQYYTDQNVTVAAGELTITAQQEVPAISGKNYSSARIRSLGKADFTYGRYEIRAKLPANQGPAGQGTWPAFWMLSSDPSIYGGWPSSGEIDILEWLGHQPQTVFGTLHYGNIGGGSANNSTTTLLPSGTTNDFHTYAVEWAPSEIRWYLDGVLYKTVNSWFSGGGAFPAPFDVPFHLILNMAVGGNFPGDPDGNSIFPQEFVVDYVRVYETADTIVPAPSAPTIVFDNFEHNDPFNNSWYAFNGASAGGGLGNNVSSVPPSDGGNWAMNTGWGSGGTATFFGGFGRVQFMDLSDMTKFSFWINPSVVSNDFGSGPVNQDYNLEINIQDDDNNNGEWNPTDDDEFQFICRVSPTGPCAITGAGWQRVEIPIADFVHDTSFATGGTGILDTAPGSNGVVHNMTIAVISNSGADVNFDTDYWLFEGEAVVEPPVEVSTPIPALAIVILGLFSTLIMLRTRR